MVENFSFQIQTKRFVIGKGVTFDAGGICLKDCETLAEFRGDMSGAAVVVAVIRACACLRLPLNITGNRLV